MKKLFSFYEDLGHYYLRILGIKFAFSKFGYLKKFKRKTHLNNIQILDTEDAQNCLNEKLSSNKPLFITRFGSVEITALKYFDLYKNKDNYCIFSDYVKRDMKNQAGFFSCEDEFLNRFCIETFNMIKNIDVLGAWNYAAKNNPSEEFLLEKYGSDNISIMHLNEFTHRAFKQIKPWMANLEGKRVLVIHPFADTICKQYEKRHLIFKNPYFLPEFELLTIKAIQGIETEKCKAKYGNWFNALDLMYEEIDKKEFDIALIGAGAFGMFLANYIKQKGKQGFHIGGASQLLFGIKGERWDNMDLGLYNEYWVRPSKDEVPDDLSNFLKGEKVKAYW